MTDQALRPGSDHLDIADVERRIKAIFIGSVGNLVEWYDFYAYTAFALYFAPAIIPAIGAVSPSATMLCTRICDFLQAWTDRERWRR